MLIDSHQHFWAIGADGHEWPTPAFPSLYRDFGPDDLHSVIKPLGVTGTILVQAQPNDAGTDWLMAVGADTPIVMGVVAWADAMSMMAGFSHVYCKLSGLITEALAKAADAEFTPYVRHLRDGFGFRYLMWGSA
jgi:predicted TIM-barrel fold metal-dependent hydrolase